MFHVYLLCVFKNTLQQSTGTWCSGITSASHAEGSGFNPQCVHHSFADCVHPSWRRSPTFGRAGRYFCFRDACLTRRSSTIPMTHRHLTVDRDSRSGMSRRWPMRADSVGLNTRNAVVTCFAASARGSAVESRGRSDVRIVCAPELRWTRVGNLAGRTLFRRRRRRYLHSVRANSSDALRGSSVKIGTIQRRLASAQG